MTRAGIALLLILAMAAPALAQESGEVTEADVAAARERRAAVSRELMETAARHQDAVAAATVAGERVQSLATSLTLLEHDLADLRAEATTVARDLYMQAGVTPLIGLFSASVFVEIPMRATYLALASERDLEVLRHFEATEAAYREQQVALDASLAEQEELVAGIAATAAEIQEKLAAADAEYQTVVTRWQRQEEERRRREEAARLAAEAAAAEAAAAAAAAAAATTGDTTTTTPSTTTTTIPATPVATAPPVVTTDGRTCPVDGATTFSDSWGASRSGGRLHKGVDMIAARGTPIVAVESGVVEKISSGSIGGLSIYYRGASGDRYYYSHLDAFADGVAAGASFDVGARLGDNGSTGNAPDSLPHLHFQWAPGGGAWVNPYPLVVELCL